MTSAMRRQSGWLSPSMQGTTVMPRLASIADAICQSPESLARIRAFGTLLSIQRENPTFEVQPMKSWSRSFVVAGFVAR